MSANLQLENQNLKLQVENLEVKMENLEVKMENLKFKHDEALRKLKAENDNLKSLVDKNKATNNQIEAKNAEISNLERQLSEKNEEIMMLMAEKKFELQKCNEEVSSSSEGKKKRDESEVRKTKQAEELEKNNQNILEGIDKYVIRKRSTTNFFPTYEDWFSWMKNNAATNGTTKFRNCVFVKYLTNRKNLRSTLENKGKLINFTEYAEFPVMNDNELAIPVVNEGWSAANTKGFLLKEISSGTPVKEFKTTFTEEINDPGVGRYFSIKIAVTAFSYVTKSNFFTVLVFVHQLNQEANEKQFLSQWAH